MSNTLTMQLNPEQLQAVEHKDGTCIVTAAPGSGKTSTLTNRVVRLIQKGVEPKNILCLTFTNKAANEMKERVAAHIGDRASEVWISTFHSFFLAILRKYGSLVEIQSNFSIYDGKEQEELIRKILRMHEMEISKNEIHKIISAINNSRENLETIDYSNLELGSENVVKEYLDCLKTFNAIDFSGILFHSYELLKNHQSVRDVLSNRFKYVLGDEWQDTNIIQYEITKMIASHGNLFVVLDLNQALYSWRGSRPENVAAIDVDFSDVKKIVLPRNYRSTSHILSIAQKLIRNNPGAKNTELISTKGSGHNVSLNCYQDAEQEAFGIVKKIKELKNKYGYKWSSFAILYRTNALSKIPEMVLRQSDIPNVVRGGFSFYDRSEVKTVLSYLKFLSNEHDTIAFSRAIQTPKRSIGPSVIGKLEKLCQDKKISILSAYKDDAFKVPQKSRQNLDKFMDTVSKYREYVAQGMSLGKLSAGFLNETGYYEYIRKESESDSDYTKRLDNINEMLVSIDDYDSKKQGAKLSDYLQTQELMSDLEQENEDDDYVSLMSVHSSKGLEFDVVFVTGVEQGILPHRNSLSQNDIAEERRIAFVAFTRARSHLFVSYCQTRKVFNMERAKSNIKHCTPSMFIEESGLY